MTEVLRNFQPLFLLAASPAIGSFLGVIIRRLPEGRSIIATRSRCEACGTTLAWYQLIPLANWAASRGRCAACGAGVEWFYPVVELAALGIAAISLLVDPMPFAWLDCLLGWWLLTLAWIDARTWRLPDVLTLPLLLAGLIECTLLEPSDVLDRAIGAILGYVLLRVVAGVYRAVRGFEGLGGGDAKLLGALGAWVGASFLPAIILAAALTALLAAGLLQLRGARLNAQSALVFGPFLSIAGWLVWLFR